HSISQAKSSRIYAASPPPSKNVRNDRNYHEGSEAYEGNFLFRVPSCSSWLINLSRSVGTTARACRQYGHRAASPTPRQQVRSAPLSRPTPSSNSADQKFHVLPSATPVKSRSRLSEEPQYRRKEPHQ